MYYCFWCEQETPNPPIIQLINGNLENVFVSFCDECKKDDEEYDKYMESKNDTNRTV